VNKRPTIDQVVTITPFTVEKPFDERSGSPHGNGDGQRHREKRTPMFKSVASFCAEYVPLDYSIDGLVRTASLYTLTARTGAGKTAFNVAAALANATGRSDILGREVAKGRVAYCAAENPDDVRMRFMIAAFLLNIDLNALGDDLVILDRRAKPEDIIAELVRLSGPKPFIATYVDTLAAYFDGDNISDPVQGRAFTCRWRPLTQIAGKPSVVISAHPVKNASADQLIPYGAGSILNEVDGNLTLWRNDAGVSLHWQGKLRGLEFEALQFRFELTGSPDILDIKDRQILLPTLRPSTAQAVEEKQRSDADVDRALLKAMIAEPNATQQAWADAIGRAKSRVNRRLQKLRVERLVEETLGKWVVTTKGRKAALDLQIVETGAEQDHD
jgi:hypothetical protein